ncbi:MAG TPA: photosynthetic reaction center cytochrome c subunit family protein [Blastocatellia bacterium]|nr:photosynthetic reaction center cytochrome c subunit family protein [Blastocatellia bacterium]
MNKEYISYGIVGIVAGLVLGFIVANSVGSAGGGAAPPSSAASSEPKAASVNSSNTGQALPPNHPPIDSGQTIPAPPLPSTGTDTMGSASQTGTSAELPSLDPLPASSKEERAEQKYKNIQLLRGIPSERLLKVMFAFKSSLGVDCTYCHIKDQFEKDDKPQKQTARKMIQLVRDTNAKLGSVGRVTCFTCHRGQTRPAQ